MANTNTKVKENAVVDFMDMTYKSWTWLRMTNDEQSRFFKELTMGCACNAITGSYEHRWKVMQALYTMYLDGLGYNWKWREKESKLADDIEQFMFERGEYDFEYADDRIRWLSSEYAPRWYTDDINDRTMAAWQILNDILNGNIKPIIDYLESEICVMSDDDESILLAEKAIAALKEV